MPRMAPLLHLFFKGARGDSNQLGSRSRIPTSRCGSSRTSWGSSRTGSAASCGSGTSWKTLPTCIRHDRRGPSLAAPPAVRPGEPVPDRAGHADPAAVHGDVARTEGVLAVARAAAPARVAVEFVRDAAVQAGPALGRGGQRPEIVGDGCRGARDRGAHREKQSVESHSEAVVRGGSLKTLGQGYRE